MNGKLKIIVADDHQMIIEGLLAVFAHEALFEIIASANNGHELLRLLKEKKPDLVILDLNMPHLDGVDTLKYIQLLHPALKTLVFSNYNNPELMNDVKELGANGYLLKNAAPAVLRQAIAAIANGESFFTSGKSPIQNGNENYYMDEFLKKYQLTKREIEIIKLICKNLRSKEIADKLFLSELTIHTHRKNIMRKLELPDSTVSLYDFALKNNLIEN